MNLRRAALTHLPPRRRSLAATCTPSASYGLVGSVPACGACSARTSSGLTVTGSTPKLAPPAYGAPLGALEPLLRRDAWSSWATRGVRITGQRPQALGAHVGPRVAGFCPVEAGSSPSDERCFSTRKKAVSCPTSGAPGLSCVSPGVVSGCMGPSCLIVDLPGRTRTPNVTEQNAPQAGSREHSQGGTDTVSGPSSMLAPKGMQESRPTRRRRHRCSRWVWGVRMRFGRPFFLKTVWPLGDAILTRARAGKRASP